MKTLLTKPLKNNILLIRMIRKVKSGFKLTSKKTGKNLGTFKTKKEAEKRERQIQTFKKK